MQFHWNKINSLYRMIDGVGAGFIASIEFNISHTFSLFDNYSGVA